MAASQQTRMLGVNQTLVATGPEQLPMHDRGDRSTALSLAALAMEIGEWAAAGLYRSLADGDPWPIPFGHAYRALYERMDIRVSGEHLLVPFEPVAYAVSRERHTLEQMGHIEGSHILDIDSIFSLRVNKHVAEEKKRRFPYHAGRIDRLVVDLTARVTNETAWVHSVIDMHAIVQRGFRAIVDGLDRQRASLQSDARANKTEENLLRALKVYAEAVEVFHYRLRTAVGEALGAAEEPRRRHLARIDDALATAFLEPAKRFTEGLIAVTMAWMLDGCDSLGRIDQILGELFENDLRSGRLDLDFARRLLDELWYYFYRYNGWQIQIGGSIAGGGDGVNDLTRECLLCSQRNRTNKPSLSLRLTCATPDNIVDEALRTVRLGAGQPAFYNDEAYVSALSELLHVPEPDVREICFGGCTETLIAGLTNCGACVSRPEMNLARPLLRAIHDGADGAGAAVQGPRTGLLESHATYEDFLSALETQLDAQVERYVEARVRDYEQHLDRGHAQLPRTLLTCDCLERRRSFLSAGTRYAWVYVNYLGSTILIDGLAAVKHCVYDTGAIDAADLRRALLDNFEGWEGLHRTVLAAPKFGNDEPRVDEPGAAVLRFAWERMLRHTGPAGRFVPSSIPWGLYVPAGMRTAATPDGRVAEAPLNDSVGAYQGRDRNGPTALLNSVAKLPLHLAPGTPVLNIRVQRDLLSSQKGIARFRALIRAFFAQGGMQVQISVLDKTAMLAAQKRPEQYRDLMVRIGGYSEYFVGLSTAMQQSIIERTEHDMPA